jgi:hypothetical protein
MPAVDHADFQQSDTRSSRSRLDVTGILETLSDSIHAIGVGV